MVPVLAPLWPRLTRGVLLALLAATVTLLVWAALLDGLAQQQPSPLVPANAGVQVLPSASVPGGAPDTATGGQPDGLDQRPGRLREAAGALALVGLLVAILAPARVRPVRVDDGP